MASVIYCGGGYCVYVYCERIDSQGRVTLNDNPLAYSMQTLNTLNTVSQNLEQLQLKQNIANQKLREQQIQRAMEIQILEEKLATAQAEREHADMLLAAEIQKFEGHVLSERR